METPLFVFLAITESGTDANIRILKTRLERSLSKYTDQLKLGEEEVMLTVNVPMSDFRFYICLFGKDNDPEALDEWKSFAENFELPWDLKEVDKPRLTKICAYLESYRWPEHRSALKLAFIILEEIARFSHVKVFTIPSFEKPMFLE
jgi:hypothetical protein